MVYDSQLRYSHAVWEKKVRILRKIGIEIGDHVAIDRGFEWILPKSLKIGEWTSIGKNFKVYNFNQIEIGKFCMFAGEVQLTNGTHDSVDFVPSSGPLIIESGCWFGHGARVVGKNLTIGANSIIGAGALVVKDVEPNSIMVGVPAKKIGTRELPNAVWHIGNTFFSPTEFILVNKSITT
jgi:acetyltransferase-like isoleucine patch superfamily enzyme